MNRAARLAVELTRMAFGRGWRSDQRPAALPASTSYEIRDPVAGEAEAWRELHVAERQHAAFEPIVAELRAGNPRRDFAALAEAIASIPVTEPLVLEVGSGSGWNGEVLRTLLLRPVRYIASDYSLAMVTVGREHYPNQTFVAADGTALPFRDGSCDIVVSGTALMHIVDYRRAIAEARRVARGWCVFHCVPVLERRSTTVMRKKAYGEWAVEVVFHEQTLLADFAAAGLVVRHEFEALPYDLVCVLGERTRTRTYVCEIVV